MTVDFVNMLEFTEQQSVTLMLSPKYNLRVSKEGILSINNVLTGYEPATALRFSAYQTYTKHFLLGEAIANRA